MTTPSGGRGGYRQPERGAPVSGPGPLSQRTDGPQGGQPVRVPTGGGYGEGQELRQLQQGAPLGATEGGEAAAAGVPIDLSGLTGFGEPTGSPDVPVTAGAALGAGPGTEALGLSQQPDEDMRTLIGYLPALEHMANRGGSKAARNLVRYIKGRAGGTA
ncbi:hypothetical protein [Streptomyces sp. URMC 129]|uniref:hypothetical protein n=1 Tax=Streptomyces sp. URMC 129 TaxID=3423407 RepID=UPI003F1E397C